MKNLSIKIAVIALHVILIIWIFSDNDNKTTDKIDSNGSNNSKSNIENTKSSKTETPTTQPAQTKYHKYVVKKGDNLSKIAQKFNTTVVAIMEENNLTSPNIHPGKQLVIKK